MHISGDAGKFQISESDCWEKAMEPLEQQRVLLSRSCDIVQRCVRFGLGLKSTSWTIATYIFLQQLTYLPSIG